MYKHLRILQTRLEQEDFVPVQLHAGSVQNP